MKIIKKGKLVDKTIKKTCFKCKTKFAYTESDTKTDRDGKYVNCPVCETFISVSYLNN